ncbi:MAG: hypothetical protein JO139_03645 [Alphaproteobacteria bacterium]|nr:hypothetical protein [Alphaproteobacteria bacterium]
MSAIEGGLAKMGSLAQRASMGHRPRGHGLWGDAWNDFTGWVTGHIIAVDGGL